MDHEPTDADFRTHTDTVEVSVARPDLGGAEQVASGSAGGLSAYRAARSVNRLVRSGGLRLWLFAVALGCSLSGSWYPHRAAKRTTITDPG